MKKMFSLALALIMALALSVPAFAEEAAAETADIAVENPAANETYNAYKIFDYTKSGTNFAYYIDTDDMVIPGLNTLIDAYAQDGVDVFTLTPSKSDPTHLNVTVNEGVTVDAVKLVEYLDDYVEDMTATATAVNGVFTGLDLGYYFVDTTMGALCSLVNAGTEQKLYEKNPTITVDKEVQEDSDESWGDESTADVGDVVPFHTIINIPKNVNAEADRENAGVQNLVMHDRMDDTLAFQDDVVVYFDATVEEIDAGEADAKVVAAENYEVVDGTDDCTFEVAFNQEWLDTITNEAHTITVCYTAILTDEAETDIANENDSKITWGENSTTEWDTTKTYTFEFDLLKYTMVDGKETPLDGAEFELTYANDNGEYDEDAAPIAFVELTEGEGEDAVVVGYRIAARDDQETVTTLKAGSIKIEGLDADEYYLTETKAPDGYNMLTEAVKVELIEKTSGQNDKYVIIGHTLEQDGEAVDLVKILNQSGLELPSTGGVGTTIFYVVGGLMMAAAGVLLVTKKKVANEEE